MASESTPTGTIAVYVTVPDKDTAKKLAASVVKNKLAACVNIIPGVESVYWWEGKVNTDSELILMMKSRHALIEKLTAHVKSIHPYTECEVISVPINGGSSSYIQWIFDSTVDA